MLFLKHMPKGGDLHNHVSGAVYSDYMFDAAIKAGKLDFVLQAFEVEPIPVHVVYLSRNVMPIKVRRFIDFAVPKLREALAGFGRIPSR